MLHSEEGGERDQGGDRCVVLLDSGWEMLLGTRFQKLFGSGVRGRGQREFSIPGILDESQLHFFSLDHEE